MTNLLKLILGVQILLFVKSSAQSEINSTTVTTDVGFTQCEKGKQFYDFDQGRCRRCPRCKRANDILFYNLKVSSEYGALECYPCYCKLGQKEYDTETKRCKNCQCNINGIKNTTVDVRVDEWFGAMDCYPCVCKHGFFATSLTHYQCVGCINCRQQNTEEIHQCSPTKDSECGGCLEGYRKVDGITCVKNKPSTTPDEDLKTVGLPTEAPVLSPVDYGSTVKRSQIITVAILIIVVCIAMVTIYICYGYITRRASHHSSLDVSMVTSGTTLSSQNSVKKNHAENVDQTLESTKAASLPLLTTDTDLAQDIVHEYIQDHIGPNLPPGTVVIQVGDGNNVIVNTQSDNTSI